MKTFEKSSSLLYLSVCIGIIYFKGRLMSKIKCSILIFTLIFNHCKLQAGPSRHNHNSKANTLGIILGSIGALAATAFGAIIAGHVEHKKKTKKITPKPKPAPLLFLERHDKSLQTYLSPVLPKGFDFYFKKGSSLKTPQQLYYLLDGDFLWQTGGRTMTEKLLRNRSCLQRIFLIENSLLQRVNFLQNGASEDDLVTIADSLIIKELSNFPDKKILDLYDKLRQLGANHNDKFEQELNEQYTYLNHNLSKALANSCRKIIRFKLDYNSKLIKYFEKFSSYIPLELMDHINEEIAERASALHTTD